MSDALKKESGFQSHDCKFYLDFFIFPWMWTDEVDFFLFICKKIKKKFSYWAD